MCGITVIFNKRKHGLPDYTESMLDAISHRGDDSVTINTHETCIVGYRRLAITEIKNKPLIRKWKVYLNGEIYNYKSLGYAGTETEVLSQGFEEHGPKFVKQLNGMFFIVAVCGTEVFCFRDRYGIKPAYYYEDENVILIASEIKSILKHPSYMFFLNYNAIIQWHTFNNVLTDDTMFKHIYKLEKGVAWYVNINVKWRYWKWEFKPAVIKYETAIHTIKYLVTQAIERQRPKETGYSCCLSGGIDSNIIAITLDDAKTFTAGFVGMDDERNLAKLTGTVNETVLFDNVKYLDETIYHLEDLRVGASWSNYGLYKRIAQEKGKVCFDGAGADELFGGYEWRYKEPNYYNVVNRTGKDSKYCERLFGKVFPVDTKEKRLLFDADYFLEGVLLVVDKLSMAHTIEMRVPFLDNDLVDYCLTLPTEWKTNKQLLKDAFKNDLPDEIINGKKRGFSSPDWIPGNGNQANKWAEAAYKEWYKQFNK
jgi:asparagine synthase (glutamine-hydrolysing)